jgi:hypothetical protein
MTAKEAIVDPSNTYVLYSEPWRGTDKDGEHVTCAAYITLTVKDAINVQRDRYKTTRPGLHLSDEELLDEFVCTHCAHVCDERGLHARIGY